MEGKQSDAKRRSRQAALGLSFSGGGFRATAFSLGTMALLQDLGLLAKAKVMSSVSGGSLALATYLCAKAGSDAERDADFPFYERFYQRLMDLLEGEQLASKFVDVGALLRGEKLICKAADATHAFLNSCLKGGDDKGEENALLGNEKITQMLANQDLSPDFVFFNATNITSLDLFRFGIERGTGEPGVEPVSRPIFVLNRFFLKHSRDSAVGRNLYHYVQRLRLADCVAASFAFPGGFEPLVFPDDFFSSHSSVPVWPNAASVAAVDKEDRGAEGAEEERAKSHFRRDLICDYKPYVALLDGGLYDNLGLSSVEDIRSFLSRSMDVSPGQKSGIGYVIATDVDQIPTQYSAYSDPVLDRLLGKPSDGGVETTARKGWGLLRVLTVLLRHRAIPLLVVLLMSALLVVFGHILFVAIAGIPWGGFFHQATQAGLGAHGLRGGEFWNLLGRLLGIAIALCLWLISVSLLAISLIVLRERRLFFGLFKLLSKGQDKTPRETFGLSETFNAKGALLDSWWQVFWEALGQAKSQPDMLWQAINARRIGQLMPAFSGYLKRTRSLTYGFLQNAYTGKKTGIQCHLIRNMIFELTPGRDVDPDYAVNLITLPISDYRHQEKLNPVSPIARKIEHARLISLFLGQLREHRGRQGQWSGDVRLRFGEIDSRDKAPWLHLDLEAETSASASPPLSGTTFPLLLSLLSRQGVELREDVGQLITDLNLEEADHIWRWLCASLSCFNPCSDGDGDSGCWPGHPSGVSLPIGTIAVKLRQLLQQQIGENDALLQRCQVSLDESTSSYSWIPLICEMATNIPTTLWLKGSSWYLPNDYDHHQRISRQGKWLTQPEKSDPGLPVIDLSALGPAPAAAVCALAGYVSTAFNLLEFFYAWLGESKEVQDSLLEHLCEVPFLFATSTALQALEELPYRLRHQVWLRLKDAERQGSLPVALLDHLALLEGPLNRRTGLPESFWTDGDGD